MGVGENFFTTGPCRPHRGSPGPRKGKDWPEVTQQELRTVPKALDKSLCFWTLA